MAMTRAPQRRIDSHNGLVLLFASIIVWFGAAIYNKKRKSNGEHTINILAAVLTSCRPDNAAPIIKQKKLPIGQLHKVRG